MAVSATDVQKAYLAYFGRPADPVGLAYWMTQDAATMKAGFAASVEYATLYAGMDSTEMVAQVYTNLLGRTAEAAGLLYWSGELAAGRQTVSTLVDAMQANALGDDITTINNRVTYATDFTAALDTTAEIVGYSGTAAATAARTAIASVTTDASLVTATAAIDTSIATVTATGTSSTGTTFTLTTAIDNITGTSGNDTIIGEAASTSTGDQINGGTGTDTLKIYDLASIVDVPTMTSVENLVLVGATGTTDLSGTGVTSVEFDNATTAQTFTVASGVSTTMKNMADGEAITITNAATATSATVTVDAMGTTADVTVNEDGAALTTVNVAATGHASFVALASTGSVSTVNVTGDQALQLTLTGETTVATLAASTFTGALTSNLGASAAATTVTTGSGADSITATAAVAYTINLGAGNDTLTTADAGGETTTADTLNGGDGTDTLAICTAEAEALDDGTAADIAVLAKITNFEQLRITNAVAGDFSIGNLGYNYLQTAVNALAADRTITGFTSGMTLEFRGADNAGNDYIIGMTGATGAGTNSDTINIKLNADLTANDTSYTELLDLEGINIVNISAYDRVTTSVADTDADGQEGYVVNLAGGTAAHSANITTVNIAGTQQVSYTVAAATTALATVDASTSTGNIIVDADLFAGTQGVVITSNSGIDTLTGSDLGDIISAGAGADTLTGGTGVDTLTGGTGADSFVFSEVTSFTAATAAALAAAADVVTDFAKASDKLTMAAANWSIVAGGAGTAGVAIINAEGIATFNAADDTLAERITAVEAAIQTGGAAAGQFAIFELGSDSYAFVSEGTDGVGAGDMLIKLAGVTGLADTTIATVNLTIA